MKFLDLFAGIGGFRLGMESAGHECVGYVEIDKFARKSYQAMHNTKGEWTAHDINKVTDEEWRQFRGEVDVITGGFPCQAFSIAGKRLGFSDETRGTLFFEITRAAKQIKPSYLFLENVKGLLNHDHGRTFRTILRSLDEIGYDVEWQLCNSKNFGVPQNRERLIIIGHLRGRRTGEVFFDTRKNGQTTSTNEILEVAKMYPNRHSSERNSIVSENGLSHTVSATTYKDPIKIVVHQLGNVSDSKSFGGNPQVGRVYATDGISPTLNTMTGGGREPKILIKKAQKYADKIRSSVNPLVKFTKNGDMRGFRQDSRKSGLSDLQFTNPLNISPTITASHAPKTWNDQLRIRKLTPRECWRLQGFPDDLFDKAAEVNSNSQLYKQAGNSVTVPLMEYIAKRFVIFDEHTK